MHNNENLVLGVVFVDLHPSSCSSLNINFPQMQSIFACVPHIPGHARGHIPGTPTRPQSRHPRPPPAPTSSSSVAYWVR
ncbi:hypothetical protein K440DRAFT_634161 [Wilcoxina mikolae CBS 423.85]|nr:hypothetical protein K440DRAFT_634161 [Wilcoxina mikolae CBS 423.85]